MNASLSYEKEESGIIFHRTFLKREFPFFKNSIFKKSVSNVFFKVIQWNGKS